ALGARRLGEHAGEARTDGVRELHVRDHAAAEEGAHALARAVDELIGHDDVPGRDLPAQAADRAHRDDPHHADLLEREDVGAEVDLGGEQAVAAPVPRQEDEARAAQAADHQLVGRRAEGGVGAEALHALEPGQVVEPAAAEDAEGGFRQTNSANAARRSTHSLGIKVSSPPNCLQSRRIFAVSSSIMARVAASRIVFPTVMSPWHWRIAPRLALSASLTASASSVEPGMNHGTVRVSARKIASVLIGGEVWFVIPNAVATGACVCTAAVASGRAAYDAQCIWYSTDGGFVPSPTVPSARMQTSASPVSPPL